MPEDNKTTGTGGVALRRSGYAWCEMCGYSAIVKPADRDKLDGDVACPWCGDNGDYSLLDVDDELPEHVAPDEFPMTWPEALPLTAPRVEQTALRALCGAAQQHAVTREIRKCDREHGHGGWHNCSTYPSSWQ